MENQQWEVAGPVRADVLEGALALSIIRRKGMTLEYIAVVTRYVDGTHQRHAKLLAAAPELAVALRDLLDVIAVDNLIPEAVSYMRQARAALAKLGP